MTSSITFNSIHTRSTRIHLFIYFEKRQSFNFKLIKICIDSCLQSFCWLLSNAKSISPHIIQWVREPRFFCSFFSLAYYFQIYVIGLLPMSMHVQSISVWCSFATQTHWTRHWFLLWFFFLSPIHYFFKVKFWH